MGFKVICLDPNPDSPCKSVAHEFITAAYDDEEALHELGEKSDVITYEFENISAEQLIRLTQKFNIPQGYQAIQLLQDRLTEKQTLQKRDLKLFLLPIKEEKDLNVVINQLGYPFIVKTRFGGYDGKGQVLVKNEESIQEAKDLISQQECVAEQFLDIALEVSLTVTIGNQNKLRISLFKKMNIEIKYYLKPLCLREVIRNKKLEMK